jgi:putative FmdB family regulatory protein
MPPIYSYECGICDAITEERRQVHERKLAPPCEVCGHATKFKITGTQIAPINGSPDGRTGLTKRTKGFLESQH